MSFHQNVALPERSFMNRWRYKLASIRVEATEQASKENTMKKLMMTLMISGAALMAQTSSAPATSTNPAPTAKVKKHHKAKTAAPNANSAAPALRAAPAMRLSKPANVSKTLGTSSEPMADRSKMAEPTELPGRHRMVRLTQFARTDGDYVGARDRSGLHRVVDFNGRGIVEPGNVHSFRRSSICRRAGFPGNIAAGP